MRNSRWHIMGALFFAASHLPACKTSGINSAAKDVTVSPADFNEPQAVIWDGGDGKVHYALCPAPPVDRNCAGKQEKVAPVLLSDYKDKLITSILNLRPKKTNSANGTYSELNQLRTKVRRLTDKVNTPGISAADAAKLNAQLTQYNAELQKMTQFSATEQKMLDDVMNALQASKNITIDEGEDLFSIAVVPFGIGLGRMSSLPLTPPGTVGNHIDIAKLLDAWNEEAEMFYGKTPTGYTQGTPVGILQESLSTCLSACPPYYSDLNCHYYCWHPSYKQVVPNVRGCFTSIARDQLVKKPNGLPLTLYPEVFDYCMYQEYDQVKNSIPVYDENVIRQRKSLNRPADRVGVLQYMSQKQEDAFKYVMFNWYNPFAFDLKDQQDILDKFYAARPANVQRTPHVASANGKSKHPNYANIIAYMQSEYASGGFGPQPAPPGSATTCPPGGKLVDGYCWYLGAPGDDCNTTCSKASLKASSASIDYIGSAGSDLNCSNVVAAFGETLKVPSTMACADNGCAKCDGTCAAPLTSSVFRCIANPTTNSAKAANIQMFCECH